MDTSIGQNDLITKDYISYWGFKNVNGIYIRNGVAGWISKQGEKFFYKKSSMQQLELVICRDLLNIVLPVASAEIAERNRKHGQNRG